MEITPVIIFAMMFIGMMGVIWMGSRMKRAEMKTRAQTRGYTPKKEQEMDELKEENKELRRRIETLEAIIVDADMKVMTGMDSDTSLKSTTQQTSDPENSEIHT